MKAFSQKDSNVDILQKVKMSSHMIQSTSLPANVAAHGDGQSDVTCRCTHCDVSGCDVRMLHCGCALHARCCPILDHQTMRQCPMCHQPLSGIHLKALNFNEIDVARQVAALTSFSDKRGKKRKNATVARLIQHSHDQQQSLPVPMPSSTTISTSNQSYISPNMNPIMPPDTSATLSPPSLTTSLDTTSTLPAATTTAPSSSAADNEVGDLRTGRWTPEETDFCDSLIRLFEEGKLPIPEGIKLNEFLANMLKSKQARLTKKMKNAKLATRQYKRSTGYIPTASEAHAFSLLEADFFASIKCAMERSEIRFHMQKEWRELFSSYCIAMGQILDANEWLSSVEELDQRTSLQKDAARMVRRKIMLGQALTFDSTNSQNRGVYINTASKLLQLGGDSSHGAGGSNNTLQVEKYIDGHQTITESSNEVAFVGQESAVSTTVIQRSQLLHELARTDSNPLIHYASPFVEKVMKIMDRLEIPFEHVDTWVPSFVDNDSGGQQQQNCRLCFAGCGTATSKVTANGIVPLTTDEKFDLMSFGEYSEKFSFEIGCGLPGRVYSSGVASWEQGIQNAPLQQFERSGGATQWGIQTVLGIPIPSPSAGRIVVLFYSTEDRPRDLKLVNRITDLITKLRPSPKWKLVVDVGVGPPEKPDEMTDEEAHLHHELLLLIQKCMPADKRSPFAAFLPGFTSLRLLLIQQTRTSREDELLKSILAAYAAYRRGGNRSETDLAVSSARDFMFLSKIGQNNTVMREQLSRNLSAPTAQHQTQILTTSIQSAPGFNLVNVNNSFHGVVPNNQTRHEKANFDGDSVQDAIVQNTFSMSGTGNEYPGTTFGVSPALHSIAESPALGSHSNFASLGNTPTLQPIPTHQGGQISELAALGMSSSPISDMLRNDTSHFQAM